MSSTFNNNDTPDIENSNVSSDSVNTETPNKKRPSVLPIQIAGGLLVLGTAVAVVVGSRSAIASIDAKNASKMAVIEQAIAKKNGVSNDKPSTTVVVASDDGSVAKYIKSYDFTTEQLNWAHEKHIKWDDNGNPVDEKGFVVDDPTTPVNEIERAKALKTVDDTGKSKVVDLKLNDTSNTTNALNDTNTSNEQQVESIPTETTKDNHNALEHAIDGDVQPGDAAPSTINKSGAGLG